jgi:hypothetical protein
MQHNNSYMYSVILTADPENRSTITFWFDMGVLLNQLLTDKKKKNWFKTSESIKEKN